MSAPQHDDPRKTPVPWKEPPQRDIHHQEAEWASGTRGGGSVPRDFGWRTNPKQQQEERGSGGA